MSQEIATLDASPIEEYRPTEVALQDLHARFANVVYDVSTAKGIAEARKGRAELRELRVSLEKTRKEIKAPALTRCQQIDAEAKRISAELSALEDPIDAQIKAEEQRKEDERKAREAAERERVTAINARILSFATTAASCAGRSSVVIKANIDRVTAIEVTEDLFAEFAGQASAARDDALATMRTMFEQQQTLEAEQERLRVERENLERQRAEQAERQAEQDRIAEEQRRQADEAARVERERLAEEDRQRRAAEDQEIVARRAETERQREAEDARRREELDRQRREEESRLEEQRAQLRREQEAAAAERARLEAEALANVTLHDAVASAIEFLQFLGHGQHQVTRLLAAAYSRETLEVA